MWNITLSTVSNIRLPLLSGKYNLVPMFFLTVVILPFKVKYYITFCLYIPSSGGKYDFVLNLLMLCCYIITFEMKYSVADPEGVGGCSTPLLAQIISLSWGISRKVWKLIKPNSPFANLNPLSKTPGSAPVISHYLLPLFPPQGEI